MLRDSYHKMFREFTHLGIVSDFALNLFHAGWHLIWDLISASTMPPLALTLAWELFGKLGDFQNKSKTCHYGFYNASDTILNGRLCI
jgi:hypothetical protein